MNQLEPPIAGELLLAEARQSLPRAVETVSAADCVHMPHKRWDLGFGRHLGRPGASVRPFGRVSRHSSHASSPPLPSHGGGAMFRRQSRSPSNKILKKFESAILRR